MTSPIEAAWTNPKTGHALWSRAWEPATVRQELVLLHGFGEHGGRYDALAQRLIAQQIRVVCTDLWGHGRSGGRRGDVERFDAYLDDLEAVVATSGLVRSARLHLFGHSFGGLLAISLSRRLPGRWASLALQAPLLKLGFAVPRWKEALGRLMGVALPTLSLGNEVDPAWLSRDPDVGRRYRGDPLAHHRISARAYRSLQGASAAAQRLAGSLAIPTLMLYGTGDRVVSPEACQAFFEGIACEKRLAVFPGAYHELHHESVAEDVVRQITEWVQSHA